MFESLKKKFSETNGKLTEKLKREAKEEDNIEESEIEETQEENKNQTNATGSFYSQFNKNEEDDDDSDEDKDEDSENSEEIVDDEEIKEEEAEEKRSFLSRFKSKKDSDGEEEDESDDTEEVDETETNEKEDEEDSKGFLSSLRRESKNKDKKDEDESSGGFFSFIKEKTLSEEDVDEILFELEMSLLEGDVAMDVADKVVNSVKDDLVGKKIKRSSDIEEYIYNALKNAVSEIINIEGKSMTEMIEDKKKIGEPLVVMLVGINGTGKTTTIGKLSDFYLKKGYTPVIAASDTFRAGAIEQVKYHADKLGVKIIQHEKGSDPAAVAFDAVSHAKATGKELVLIDTAGRMQNNTNLMDEMKKIKRVSKPDLVVFVGDALTGNDATMQASKFNDAIDIDGVILTKADADSKGGASLSIGYVIKKPILFLGMGQEYSDIIEYDPDWMLNQLFG